MQATPIGPPSLIHQPLLADTHTHIRKKSEMGQTSYLQTWLIHTVQSIFL